jgi:hypothetical protein
MQQKIVTNIEPTRWFGITTLLPPEAAPDATCIPHLGHMTAASAISSPQFLQNIVHSLVPSFRFGVGGSGQSTSR